MYSVHKHNYIHTICTKVNALISIYRPKVQTGRLALRLFEQWTSKLQNDISKTIQSNNAQIVNQFILIVTENSQVE